METTIQSQLFKNDRNFTNVISLVEFDGTHKDIMTTKKLAISRQYDVNLN